MMPPQPISPDQAVQRYIVAAMHHAVLEKLDDGTWYAHVPKIDGPWGNSQTEKDALDELREVLGEWIELKKQDREPLPLLR